MGIFTRAIAGTVVLLAAWAWADEDTGLTEIHDPADAKVAGTDFHATGTLPCSMSLAGPRDRCEFGVTREGYGNGTVIITKPDGRTRAIFFKDGTAFGADTSEADPGDFGADRVDDMTLVSIGDERYEIPDAVIYGG